MEMVLLMPFLYFPEDKSLYIPAFLTLFLFMALGYVFFQWIRKKSRQEEEKARELEKQVLSERNAKQPPRP
ncbi:hypothetical protein [Bhargavaea cecembensis]|uniref:hypothetical protein n=1 Tax=Bhargavaea cecembensis TaxID=394098 RepID=UPI0005907CB2|nr:hypothetical protein [Bhargavaea cecembensis]